MGIHLRARGRLWPVFLVGAPAYALPPAGAAVPEFHVETPDGASMDRAQSGGKPLLVVYEDKANGETNRAFKDTLAKASREGNLGKHYRLAPIADVAAYDYWPARSFVKSAIREQEKRSGTRIYCDWSGAARTAFQVRPGTSSILLFGRDGRLVHGSEGPLDAAARDELLALLRRESAPHDSEGPSAAK
jgi:hypothetical protein